MTRISFVSAVRNEATHIEEMIDSWARQSADTELIVVDDNSTDATPAIVAELVGRHSGLTLLSLAENGGQRGKVAAFNLGVTAARGDFIALFGGDDVMPLGSVGIWTAAVEPYSREQRVAAFGKLQTMSESDSHDGMILPRGTKGERSGGTSMFSRGLSELVFPIPAHLPSEDIWTSFLLPNLADVVIEVPEVILYYRIHEGNSNPRGMGFAEMSKRIADRKRAYAEIRDLKTPLLSPAQRTEIDGLIALEAARQQGNPRVILSVREVPLKDRLRALAMSSPGMWSTRQRFFRAFSGW